MQVQDAAGNALAIGGRDPGEGGLFKLPINGAAEASHMVAEQPDNSENIRSRSSKRKRRIFRQSVRPTRRNSKTFSIGVSLNFSLLALRIA